MEVSRSRYYQYFKQMNLQPSKKELELICEVKELDKLSRHSYGSRQISKNLKAKDYNVGRYAARTLMHKAGVVCQQRRRFKVTTDSKHSLYVSKNRLARQFSVSTPNKVWVTDISYLWTTQGWLYIAGVLDLFSRRVVGWAIESYMRSELIESALRMALGRRKPENGLMHHSDRGIQYACNDYQTLLKTAGITVSMSRKGNCWDNAVMERFWGSLKSERINRKIYATKEEAKADVIDYIEMFYNSKRLHSTLNYVSPINFENQFRLKNMSTFTWPEHFVQIAQSRDKEIVQLKLEREILKKATAFFAKESALVAASPRFPLRC